MLLLTKVKIGIKIIIAFKCMNLLMVYVKTLVSKHPTSTLPPSFHSYTAGLQFCGSRFSILLIG